MAKKITRGITGIKDINKQDFDTNNVNDLLSDGQYNYIHRKKGKTEEYHNLTDNLKTLSSDNTDLLTVTNNNKTTNTATLHPKHDAQKEQVLESERATITIKHGTNATTEKTKVDTNPQKVLEHTNLLTDYGISKTTSGNTTKLGVEYTKVPDSFDLNTLGNGCVRGHNMTNAPTGDWYFVKSFTESSYTIQRAISLDAKNTAYMRLKREGNWGAWREQVGDKSVIDGLLARKQDTLVAGEGITIQGQTISASGDGAPVVKILYNNQHLTAIQHVVTTGNLTVKTFSFEISAFGTVTINNPLKQELLPFVPQGSKFINGGLELFNDTGTLFIANTVNGSENDRKQATFTFYTNNEDSGSEGGVVTS